MMRSNIEKICRFYRVEMCKKNIYLFYHVKKLEKDLKSRCKPHLL